MKISVYCDGSCDWKSRLGGAGVFITDGNNDWFFSDGYKDTTISRMEGMALLTALRSINPDIEIEADIYSDSEYIIKSFTEKRLVKWDMIGFQGVANQDMWRAILKEISLRPLLKLNFKHIRGHQKNTSDAHICGNTIADLLANYKNKEFFKEDKM